MPLKNPVHMAELYTLLGRVPAEVYGDRMLDEALSHALLLEEEEGCIAALGQYSLEDILYGRYYWYTKFLCRYAPLRGADGSMEQAQFQIIEAMDHAGIVDSEKLEAIEKELGYPI